MSRGNRCAGSSPGTFRPARIPCVGTARTTPAGPPALSGAAASAAAATPAAGGAALPANAAKPANPGPIKQRFDIDRIDRPPDPALLQKLPAKPTKPDGGEATRALRAAPGEAKLVDPTTYKPVTLTPFDIGETAYPPFDGKKLRIVHTENVVGELEPCG